MATMKNCDYCNAGVATKVVEVLSPGTDDGYAVCNECIHFMLAAGLVDFHDTFPVVTLDETDAFLAELDLMFGDLQIVNVPRATRWQKFCAWLMS